MPGQPVRLGDDPDEGNGPRGQPQGVDLEDQEGGQHRQEDHQTDAEDHQNAQQQAVVDALQPQGGEVALLDPQHGRQQKDQHQVDGGAGEEIGFPHALTQQEGEQRLDAQQDRAHGQDPVEGQGLEIVLQIENHIPAVPGFPDLFGGAVAVDGGQPLFGQDPFQEGGEGPCQLQQEGGGEGGDHGDRHDDGIEEGSGHRQRLAQARDDERELTHLGLGGGGVEGGFQLLPGGQAAQSQKQELAQNGHHRQDEDGEDVFQNHIRLDHKAHGHEEDAAEEVLAGGDQPLHPLGVKGAGQKGTGQEGPQLGGQADLLGQDGHEEAEPQGEDEEHLVVHNPHQLFREGGNQIDAQNQPQGQVEKQDSYVLSQSPAADGLRHGNGGQNDHSENGDDVLDDQGAHGQTGERFLLEPHVLDALHGDHGGGHGQHDPQENAVHGAPAQEDPQEEAHHAHAQSLDAGGQEAGYAYLGHFVDGKLQAETEHQEDDADVRPDLDGPHVIDGGDEVHHRTGQESRQNIAQHRGKIDFFA